jgi:DNA-directed RNA polymerase subunit K/omega
MSNEILSRTSKIDLEKCVENAGNNRFDLILIASARVREIAKQQASSHRREHVFPTITALLDVQEGKVGREYLKKI